MLKVQDFSCLIFSFFKATLFFTTIASLLAVFQNCDQTETAFLLTALHVTLTQGQRQICTDWILRPCEHHIGPGWPIAFFISYFSQETPIEALKMVKFDFMVRRWGVWWDVWPQCGIIFTVHCVGEKVGKKKCEGAADTFKRKVNAAGNVKVWQQLPCKGQGQI